MYRRMLLLSLGWKTHDPYEREVKVALHAYHGAMFGSVFLVLTLFYGVGFVVTGSMVNALYFLLLPPLVNVRRMVLLVTDVLLLSMVAMGMFMVFFLLTLGNILDASVMTMSTMVVSFILSKFTQRKISKESFLCETVGSLSEHPTLTKHVETISRRNNIRPMTVYLCETSLWLAHASVVGQFRYIYVSTELHKNISKYSMLGVLGHELGHFVIPLGLNMFFFFQKYVFMSGDLLTLFFERQAMQKMFQSHESSLECKLPQKEKELFQCKCLMNIALMCSWFSSYPASQKKEYVADACSALILRDVVPLIGSLTVFKQLTRTNTISSTHPTDEQRIDRLKKIEARAEHTRR